MSARLSVHATDPDSADAGSNTRPVACLKMGDRPRAIFNSAHFSICELSYFRTDGESTGHGL